MSVCRTDRQTDGRRQWHSRPHDEMLRTGDEQQQRPANVVHSFTHSLYRQTRIPLHSWPNRYGSPPHSPHIHRHLYHLPVQPGMTLDPSRRPTTGRRATTQRSRNTDRLPSSLEDRLSMDVSTRGPWFISCSQTAGAVVRKHWHNRASWQDELQQVKCKPSNNGQRAFK